MVRPAEALAVNPVVLAAAVAELQAIPLTLRQQRVLILIQHKIMTFLQVLSLVENMLVFPMV